MLKAFKFWYYKRLFFKIYFHYLIGSVFGLNVGGKLGGNANNEENKQVNENLSKIKFSIPIVYPTITVNERPAFHASLPEVD